MKMNSKQLAALFLAGFFTKDVIDNIVFLLDDNYPISILGLTITVTEHRIMLIVSSVLTIVLLWYALQRSQRKPNTHV